MTRVVIPNEIWQAHRLPRVCVETGATTGVVYERTLLIQPDHPDRLAVRIFLGPAGRIISDLLGIGGVRAYVPYQRDVLRELRLRKALVAGALATLVALILLVLRWVGGPPGFAGVLVIPAAVLALHAWMAPSGNVTCVRAGDDSTTVEVPCPIAADIIQAWATRPRRGGSRERRRGGSRERDPGIRFRCPHCKASPRVPSSCAGRAGRCPRCKGSIEVPTIRRAPAAAAA